MWNINPIFVTGIIGYASPVTHQEYVSSLLNPSSQVYDDDDSSAQARLKDEADHYESMMNKLNRYSTYLIYVSTV